MSTTSKSNYRGITIRVAVPSPLRRVFDYLPPAATPEDIVASSTDVPPDALRPGIRVRVPFGNRKLIGIVVEVTKGSSLTRSKLKPVIAILDQEPLFSDSVFTILLWAANYYQHPLGEVFATAMPAKLRNGIQLKQDQQVWTVVESPPEEKLRSLARAFKQKALFEFVASEKQVSRTQCQQAGFSSQLLKQLLAKNLIQAQLVRKSVV